MRSGGETQYAKSGDVSIAYQAFGEGRHDLVLVPGIISHVEFFHELPGYTDFLRALSSFARVVVLDKRGNGLSDRIAGAAPLEDRMDDVRAVMDAVVSDRATILGISEGGPISLLFAATYPERVERVVLYETFVRYGGVGDEVVGWDADAHRQFTDFMVESYGTGASLAGFGASFALDPDVRELWGRAERLSNSPGGFRAIYGALLEMDVRAALPSVRAPCLVIHAAGAVSMFEQQSKYLAGHLPDARLVAIDGVDHFPWFSNYRRVVAEVEQFVTGTQSAVPAERVLTTIVFIDIVDSTQRAAELGDHQWRALLEDYYELVRRELERSRGMEVGTAGDGFVARFDGPARAVGCAMSIRDGIRRLGLEVRVGVHTGEVELHGSDVTGLAAHIAARVMSLADANEVLVSRTVKDLVVGSDIDLASRGPHTLKGVPEAWDLYAASTS